MKFRKREYEGHKGKNWMSAMGILFIVMASIIALSNDRVTNEKFVIAMIIAGAVLLWWGYFKKKEDYGPPDAHERRRFYYDK